VDLAITKDCMLHAFMFTLSGVPVIYSGDEIAQTNDWSYHNDPIKAEDSRYLHRGNLDWKKAKKRNSRTGVEAKVFKAIKKMEQIRFDNRCFDSQADATLFKTGNNSVLGIKKEYRGQTLIALFNFSDNDQCIWLMEGNKYRDLWTGKGTNLPYADIPAGSFRWLVLR